mmetsp:Transcript_3766/g.12986  ORF Transcript_3766/g.12986 Transcript_3766/m.12986 type:complete len:270 (-) Transcript_3766:530-1339(-)
MGGRHVAKRRVRGSVRRAGFHVPVRGDSPEMGQRVSDHVLRGDAGPGGVRLVHPAAAARGRDPRDAAHERVPEHAREGEVGEEPVHLRGRVRAHGFVSGGGERRGGGTNNNRERRERTNGPTSDERRRFFCFLNAALDEGHNKPIGMTTLLRIDAIVILSNSVREAKQTLSRSRRAAAARESVFGRTRITRPRFLARDVTISTPPLAASAARPSAPHATAPSITPRPRSTRRPTSSPPRRASPYSLGSSRRTFGAAPPRRATRRARAPR